MRKSLINLTLVATATVSVCGSVAIPAAVKKHQQSQSSTLAVATPIDSKVQINGNHFTPPLSIGQQERE